MATRKEKIAGKTEECSGRLANSGESVGGFFGKFFRYLCNGQFDRITCAIIDRIPRWVFYSSSAYIFELACTDRPAEVSVNMPSPSFPEGYTCRLMQREEISVCSQLIGLCECECHRRLDAGDLCFGVFSPNGLANVTWVHAGSCFIRGLGYLHQGSVHDYYIYGIMTGHTMRGKGLYKNCLKQVGAYLFNGGSAKLVQMVEEGNIPVLKTLPQLGYRQTKRIFHMVVLGLKGTVIRDVASGSVQRTGFLMSPTDIFII